MTDLTRAGVTVLNIETSLNMDLYRHGVSDCETEGDLAISGD